MNIKAPNCVLDKGFYSRKNVDSLLKARSKFTLAAPLNNKWLQRVIDGVGDIHGPEGYQKLDDEILYVHSSLYRWGKDNRRCYLDLYYNAYARAKDVDQFNEKLVLYKSELEEGKLVKEHQETYDTFFLIKTTPKRGTKVAYNKEAINQYIKKYAGFQALLSNGIKDPVKALQVYRDKDRIEKCFNDLKNQLDMKRLRMHNWGNGRR